jgi:hypothetical protein
MHKRPTTILILTAAVAAIAAQPAYASRSCGSIGGYHVTITRGSVSCAKARTVAKEWQSGKGVTHRVSAYTLWYTSLPGGWDCSTLNMGHVGCVRGGLGSLKNGFTYEATRHAHKAIEMVIPG